MAGQEPLDRCEDEAEGLGHSHEPTSSRKLAIVAGINLLGFLGEFAGGLLFGSVALLSDAVHMLFDALAYVMAFAAAYVAANYDGSARFSYGLHRLEPLAAFLNGLFLIPMVGFILWESYQRYLAPIEIGTGPTLLIAVGGLLINLGSVYVLHGGEMSLNERGAFYHLLGDAGGSVAVIVSVTVVELTGLVVIDPITAVLIAGVVLWSAGKVLRGSAAIFVLKTPFDPETVREEIDSLEGVIQVEDLHASQICSRLTVASAHVRTTVETMTEADQLTTEIHQILRAHGANHVTVELHPRDGDERTYSLDHSH
ncbi:cation diffusion facilitator family transporter [Halodesulfurarchaeum formicicum]|uniref:Cation diffusion facilitator family transporter n=1 Tax=Halodesulfurarchaeum formicicum TaxID=1873524 RepID=A0A1D8S390_9EURY|nr:cation diffusion facilitator family transporter [Halodesulfurarchaeum formicicum]AOW79826.1 cation diffusion facilitator family transporter [Halodesulfurarchaeum formicicum]APE95118.1 cation diffusion facilitator family transporter [Halodesulfurarchaeum formicicum]